MKNTAKIIEAFTLPYNKNARFIKNFNLDENNIGVALFETNSEFYCHGNHPVEYFTAAEMQICLNQLLYIYCTHMNFIPFDDTQTLNKEQVEKLAKGKFITEQSYKFKKAIKTLNPIEGTMQLIHSRKIGKTIVVDCKFSFGAFCTGNVKVAIQID